MHGTTEMLPVQIYTLIPKPDETADCATYGVGSDSNKYAVKQIDDNPNYPFAPFDELFCYELARYCSIAVPQYRIIEMPDSSLAFGSMWEGGVINNGLNTALLNCLNGDESKIERDLLVRQLSAIYAFDLFVHNEDRHAGNYLVKDIGDRHVLLAMDFGRSWNSLNCPIDRTLAVVSPPILPLRYLSPPHPISGQDSNTFKIAKLLWNINQLGGLNGAGFFDVLNRLLSLPDTAIMRILDMTPSEWCSDERKESILRWWRSSGRQQRINKIKLGFQHGNLV